MTFEEWWIGESYTVGYDDRDVAWEAWQAAQQAEMERIMKALDASLMLRGGIPSEALLLARSAIAKYRNQNEP